jgi:hypothetical protein
MKKAAILICLFLISCAPSAKAIQEAIQQTQNAYTPTPWPPTATATIEPTATVTPTITMTSTPTFVRWTVQQVQDAILIAGLEFANPRPMEIDDYGAAPMTASEGIRFLIPSLCSDCGGRLFSFTTQTDLDLVKSYYEEFGKQSALLFSWVFTNGNILIQINGDLPKATAEKYQAVIENLK